MVPVRAFVAPAVLRRSHELLGGLPSEGFYERKLQTQSGVKLNSIKKMSIGVGDKTKTASGAIGILYIDDIAFGHPAQ